MIRFFVLIFLLITNVNAQQVFNKLNVKELDVTSRVNVISTTKASKPCPAMTATQRNALVSPLTGSCVYNTSDLQLNVYDGTSWQAAGGGGIDNWETAKVYDVDSVVIESNKIYQCEIAHTSGTFATDLAAGKWVELSATPNLTGEVTTVGSVATLSNPAVIGKVLTGFTSGAGTVSSSDSILGAIQKIDGNTTLQNVYGKSTSPQITTTTPLGSVDLKRGSAADTDNVFRIQNGSSVNKLQVKGNGETLIENKVTADNLFNDANLLVNPSFEHATLDSGWTISGGGTSTASTTNLQSGARSLSRTSTGAWEVYQDTTLYAAGKVNQEAEASIWVYSANANAVIWLCPRSNGSSPSASVANGCTQYTNLGQPQKLSVYMLYGSTSTGISISGSGAITYILDKAELKDRVGIVNGEINSPWVGCTFSTLAWQGFGTIASNLLECKRNGSTLKMRGRFQAGTTVTSTARIPLPSNWGSVTAKVSGVSSAGTFHTNVASQSNLFNAILDNGINYIEIAGPLVSGANNPYTSINGSTFLSSSGQAFIYGELTIPITEWVNNSNAFSTKCDDPRQCETVFSASVSASGVVSGENLDWINGNITPSSNLFPISFNSGIFTVAPNCFSTPDSTSLATAFVYTSETSSGVTMATTAGGSGSAQAFNITCFKTGVDYSSSKVTQQIVQMRGVPTIPSVVSPKIFGLSKQDSVCSSNPCTPSHIFNQPVVGTTFERSSTGIYVVTFNGVTLSICTAVINPLVNQTSKCQLSSGYGGASARVLCFNSAGTPVDEGFSLNCSGY